MGANPRATSDEDLMDLASRHSYRNLSVNTTNPVTLRINGNFFLVRDKIEDKVTGLDAYTFENEATGELTVAFAGTVGKLISPDVWTDAQLVTALTPAQFVAAQAYVDRVATDPELGPVTSVCGNSLGGGIAAYIAGRDGGIRAVTVNPAPVPSDMAGTDAPNIRNYISTKTDVLYRAVVAGGMRDRILGDVVHFDGTRLGADYVLTNHMGSEVFRTGADRSYDGSMGVPFSLFHQNTLVGSGNFGARIDVTFESFDSMARALEAQYTDLDDVLGVKLSHITSALEEHVALLDHREATAKEYYREALNHFLAPVYTRLEDVRLGVDQLEAGLKQLNPPGPLRLAWDTAVTVIAEPTDMILAAVLEVIEFGVAATAEVIWDMQALMFHSGSQEISRELLAQNASTREHVHLVKTKWEIIARYTASVSSTLSGVDDAVAAAIASGTCLPGAISVNEPSWPARTVDVLGGSTSVNVYQWTNTTRDEVVSALLSVVVSAVSTTIVAPLTMAMRTAIMALETLEGAFGLASSTVRNGIKLAAANPLALVTGTSDDLWRFQDRIGDLYDDFKRSSDTWQTHLEQVRSAIAELPTVILTLGPNIAQGIIADSVIENVYNSYSQTRNIIDRAEISFAEIDHQLRGHKAAALDALALRADDLTKDLATTSGNLDDMIG